MEYTKETALQYVKDVLVKNGFTQEYTNIFQKETKVRITIDKNYYIVTHYDEGFLEWMDWFSPDLTIYPLLGYLSFNDFIERGYKK